MVAFQHSICCHGEIKKILYGNPSSYIWGYGVSIASISAQTFAYSLILICCFIFIAPALAHRCDVGVPWPVRSSVRTFVRSSTIDSGYLVSATPTVFGQSFWNFTDVLAMVYRCACCLLIILRFFFFQLFPLC